MTESLPSQCMKFTNDLINDPLASFFVYPPDKKLQADYNAKIKKPMDLSTIKKKIKDNIYTSFQEWVDDMYLIFNNAIEFNDATSLLGGVAIYLRKQFDKKIREIESFNLRNYEMQLITFGKRLESILIEPPPTFGVELKTELSSKNADDFTVPRIMEIKNNLEKMLSEGHQKEILDCINESNTDYMYTDGQEIDLSHLGRRTLIALEALFAPKDENEEN
ncbi:Bromodomain containing protein [Tritrichomonas foetus]|uniref:Bromodomain containing protein n=1 Tax=Tritrichomonas foetus TaxID=1144522 RepID=A0A1J4JAH7_9EUKA|nr:Bromodomain containing protein [Tritrichomonas foetus]|eukprot:OHS96178.1 Bromodomain containing protein [Tritrichomonas foetus]